MIKRILAMRDRNFIIMIASIAIVAALIIGAL